MEYHHTFSCISSFSLSFVFTLLAKLFSLFSNSFSSMYSSNKVTCLQEEIAQKMVSSWWFGKQCKHIPPIQGNGKRQQGTAGKRFPTLRLSSLFLRFLYLLRLPHGLVLVSFSGLTLSQHILGRPPGAFFRVSSTAGQRQIYPVYFWSCQLAHLVHTAV